MEKYLDGLLLQDLVLIVLGTLMFLVLLGALVLNILRREPLNKFQILGFIIPAVMIAYPSIQKMAFSKDMIELEKMTTRVVEAPEDTMALQALEKKTQEVESRKPSSPDNLAKLSKSNYLLGHKDKAKMYADSALNRSKNITDAKAVRSAIDLQDNLEQLKNNPDDTEQMKKAQENFQTLKGLPIDKKSMEIYIKPLKGINKTEK